MMKRDVAFLQVFLFLFFEPFIPGPGYVPTPDPDVAACLAVLGATSYDPTPTPDIQGALAVLAVTPYDTPNTFCF